MKLSVPRYLEASNCQDNLVQYVWDDWHEQPKLRSLDKELVTRLTGISQRAVLAFACGNAEWIIYRFERLCDITIPWNLIQTTWAMIVNLRYCVGPECWSYYSQKGWEGPIKGPIRKALEYLEAANYLLSSEYQTDPAIITCKISNLTSYVLSNSVPYRRWCDQILNRLETLYPRDPKDPLGDVVPKQAIDPEFDFKVEQTEALINQFLAGLDFHTNIFLSTPEDILGNDDEVEEEFQGIPYVFSIEADRKARRKATGHSHDT